MQAIRLCRATAQIYYVQVPAHGGCSFQEGSLFSSTYIWTVWTASRPEGQRAHLRLDSSSIMVRSPACARRKNSYATAADINKNSLHGEKMLWIAGCDALSVHLIVTNLAGSLGMGIGWRGTLFAAGVMGPWALAHWEEYHSGMSWKSSATSHKRLKVPSTATCIVRPKSQSSTLSPLKSWIALQKHFKALHLHDHHTLSHCRNHALWHWILGCHGGKLLSRLWAFGLSGTGPQYLGRPLDSHCGISVALGPCPATRRSQSSLSCWGRTAAKLGLHLPHPWYKGKGQTFKIVCCAPISVSSSGPGYCHFKLGDQNDCGTLAAACIL